MSSGLLLDLPTEEDVTKLKQWIARKWRPLWSWYATKEEALAIASAAMFKSQQTWDPKCKSNKVTWAVNTARLAYLVNHGHEARVRRSNMRVDTEKSLSLAAARPVDSDRAMDVDSVLAIARRAMGERHYQILSDATKHTRRETAKMHGIGLSRLHQIEMVARAKARDALRSVLAKNKCRSLSELI